LTHPQQQPNALAHFLCLVSRLWSRRRDASVVDGTDAGRDPGDLRPRQTLAITSGACQGAPRCAATAAPSGIAGDAAMMDHMMGGGMMWGMGLIGLLLLVLLLLAIAALVKYLFSNR